MQQDPLDEARELILGVSKPEDAKQKIAELEKLSPVELNKQLEAYYSSAAHLAQQGNTQTISTMLRVFEHFGDSSHDRMLLHYIAQAEANKALTELDHEKKPHHEDMIKALKLIADAFTDADNINEQIGKK